MLTPERLEALPERMVELYSQAEADILSDMARRIAAMGDFIPTVDWQYRKLREMGVVHRDITAKLARLLNRSEAELLELMRQSGAEALKDDDAIYRAAGRQPPPLEASPEMQQVLMAGYANTRGVFDNLTRTTAATATRQFERALDRGYMLVTTGARSQSEAVRGIIKELAEAGVESIAYPTGHTDHLDVAVRRAVRTGVGQTALRLQSERAEEMGCDLVETSAHAGARPSHQAWQGQIFSRSGKHPKYPEFTRATGYGSGAGLGGWNCRHSFHPFFEGVSRPAYSEEERRALDGRMVTLDGTPVTLYEATQRQRNIERQIRRWKREFSAMDAAGLDTSEAAAKLRRWRETERDFLQQTGLKGQSERSQVEGFGREPAARASARATLLDKIEKDAILKSQSGAPRQYGLPDEFLQFPAPVDQLGLHGVVPSGAAMTKVYVMAGKDSSVPIRDVARLHLAYGGDIALWQKKSGDVEGEWYRYVVHWYECEGRVPPEEIKLKGVKQK